MSFQNAGNPLCWTDQQRGFPVFTKQTEGNRLIICLLICSCIVYLTFSCHNITFEIFVISRNLVYHASIRKKLDDAVRSCLYDLMVTAGKQDDTREFDHTIIQCGDGFHIQVVCRLIKDQNVASANAARRFWYSATPSAKYFALSLPTQIRSIFCMVIVPLLCGFSRWWRGVRARLREVKFSFACQKRTRNGSRACARGKTLLH